ncbi:c-type cytochrome [Muriicola soli]|uniref:Cytochrome c n=1 Tax=Muriicola soli TaxID=2507538 RepID=A0A411E679_9FLAO|nr:cytochrome c [Muriicola soli]QBA63216.1 cytochrome c [Muriicola soli]
MKSNVKIIVFLFSLLLISCGSKEEKKEGFSLDRSKSENTTEVETASDELPPSQRVTLDEKGVGLIKDITLDPEIDTEMAAEGEKIFMSNCTACHKLDKRFIGPSPIGIMERRSPEWIMNMILDPKLMTEQDRCAKDLMVEFNGAAMANQNMTIEQTRAILEYFRTL